MILSLYHFVMMVANETTEIIKGAQVGRIVNLRPAQPILLDSGFSLTEFPIAFQTYGTLNEDKSNAILICHALSGDQYVASQNPLTGKNGWWDILVGQGLTVDISKYFVICTNVIGGCMGSWGPASINPVTGKQYGLDFPVITIADMVRAQNAFVEHLGISRLLCVIGGSMGGMQAVQWAAMFPDKVTSCIVVSSATRHTAQNISFHEIGRQAIMADPNWCGGRYYDEGKLPSRGLGVARMVAHVTYLSEAALTRKFGRNLNKRSDLSFNFDADFSIESYLRHQGSTFVQRFDPNSYLYITRAIDYFDLAEEYGTLADAFKNTRTRFCVISFSSDWLFPTSESRLLVRALNSGGANVSFVELESDRGHDAFLLDEPDLFKTVGAFIDSVSRREGVF